MDFLENQTRINFPENQMRAAVALTNPKKTQGAKKKMNFFLSSLGVLHGFSRKSNMGDDDDDLNKSRKHKKQKKSI